MLEFRVLGPLEAVTEAGPIQLGGPKQRATLAILLLDANRVVSVERLADDLYAGAPPVTAVTQVQRQVSELRKAVGSTSLIETRPPGYLIRLAPDQLDLYRFERLAEQSAEASERGDAVTAANLLQQALGLWRGPPLDDLAYEPFARPAIERLEEMRLDALEQRLEANLALGRHREVVSELHELVAAHPFRERLRAQLMLALYRSGRQAEALDAYRHTRVMLVGELGIEPGPALQELERAILAHDPALNLARGPASRDTAGSEATRAVLVIPDDERRLDDLLTIGDRLAQSAGRELIVTRLVREAEQLRPALLEVEARRESIVAPVRAAAFTSREPGDDVAHFVGGYNVDLVLLDVAADIEAPTLPGEVAQICERCTADVAVLTGSEVDLGSGVGVFVPFGGGEHDWAALEIGAWLAAATRLELRLLGTLVDSRHGQRDASRLLADASLAVQRVVGVKAEPLLAEPTNEALLAAVADATLIVIGISPRWRREGIGSARRVLVGGAQSPVLLVHRGPRPGGLAPRERRTSFTWSIGL
jgi:DNA-binding SARP family transcriptional activator